MALEPTDAAHAGQIAAGIEGRNRGHAFEKAIAEQIKELSFPIKSHSRRLNHHQFVGDPSSELIRYIVATEKLVEPKIEASYWLGGLATARAGDSLVAQNGLRVTGSKSDVVVSMQHANGKRVVGISIKTCFNPKPTNAQLYCSTASAFCALLRRNSIDVSIDAEIALRMFCGDPGYQPLDNPDSLRGRLSTPERWFWEELPDTAREEWEVLLENRHQDILTVLLRNAYADDPFPPDYVFHLQNQARSPSEVPMAIYAIHELTKHSEAYAGFRTRPYIVRKGRFKDDPNIHLAPRFGIVQFQPLGNNQNRNQLQFNLEANYFSKLDYSRLIS